MIGRHICEDRMCGAWEVGLGLLACLRGSNYIRCNEIPSKQLRQIGQQLKIIGLQGVLARINGIVNRYQTLAVLMKPNDDVHFSQAMMGDW